MISQNRSEREFIRISVPTLEDDFEVDAVPVGNYLCVHQSVVYDEEFGYRLSDRQFRIAHRDTGYALLGHFMNYDAAVECALEFEKKINFKRYKPGKMEPTKKDLEIAKKIYMNWYGYVYEGNWRPKWD